MTDTTLSLAARLAANLIVDAINLAKPGARLAGKIGDRALNLIGGPAFSEREAQRFLMDGADALNKVESQVDSLDPQWHISGPGRFTVGDPDAIVTIPDGPAYEFGRDVHLCTTWDGNNCHCVNPYPSAAPQHNTMPNWQAPQSSAPVAPKPTDVAGSPGSASAPPLPGADSGHLNQPVGVGAEPGADGSKESVPLAAPVDPKVPTHCRNCSAGIRWSPVLSQFVHWANDDRICPPHWVQEKRRDSERIAGMTRHDLRIMLGAASTALKIVERVHPEDDFWAHLGLRLREASEALR